MTTRTLTRVTLLLTFAGLWASAATAYQAGRLTIEPRPGDATLAARTDLAPGLLRGARLTLFDGRRQAALPLGPARLGEGPADATLAWTPEPGLEVDLRLQAVGSCLLWEVRCRNRGQESRWLELGPALDLQPPAGQAQWFDGWDDKALTDADQSSVRMAGNMPMTALWTPDACLAVGLEPTELVSWFRHSVARVSEDALALSCTARCVVDPGAEAAVRFVTLATLGEWGRYEAFDAYYASFPECFRAHPEVDPRASLGSSQYRAWPTGSWSPEICRRLYGGWEWCYAPFKRTGDIVGRPELWDYTPVRPFGTRPALPRDEYLAWREKAFTDGAERCGVAMMFYIPAQVWCEEQLARERYADALVTDPRAKTYFSTPWVTGHDNELLVFPHATSFGDQTRRDLAEIAETLPIAGFAFDTAGGVARYTGPALPRLEGRAWDDEVGVYCSELVAIAKVMDYVHTLRRDGRRLAVVSNPMATGSYASCVRSDSAMLERSPWQHSRTESDRLRWKLGHKTMVWWEGYEAGDFVDLATVKPDDLAAVYEGLADFTLLQSLRVGAIPPTNFTQGIARLVRWLPAIVDCVQTGWEPVPAVRLPAPAWASRYGRGLETRLALAQETGEDLNLEAEVLNPRLGTGAMLFAHADGRPQVNRVRAGNTLLPLRLAVRTPVLLRAMLAVEPSSAVSTAEVALRQEATRAVLQATVTGAGTARLRLATPAGMRPTVATWAGQPLALRVTAGAAEAEVNLGEAGRLEVAFTSDLFALSDEALLGFPFVSPEGATATLLVAADAPVAVTRAAARLQEYFRYWHGRIEKPAREVLLPIRPEAAVGPAVSIALVPGRPATVRREGDRLIVEADSAAALEAAVDRLLQALDRRWWTSEIFGQTAVRDRLAAFSGRE